VEGSDASAAASSANKVCCTCIDSNDTRTILHITLENTFEHVVVPPAGLGHSVQPAESMHSCNTLATLMALAQY
jgi:hypothetical protein